MKKLINLSFLLFALALVSVSCSKDDKSDNYGTQNTSSDQTVTAEITENTTWTSDKIWILDKRVVVKEGVTLTIEPGTIIKGKKGSATLTSALVISQGAKIMAEGTADKPIIFTSEADDIKLGQKNGTNLTISENQFWDGLIILGKAKGSFENDTETYNIEGISAESGYGVYGGTEDNDNSGVLKYISIRHGGAEIGSGNEINGLTLGCVSDKTAIENIEVVANFDDGIEFFGGTVNVKNVLVYSVGDDALDIHQAYGASITNALVIQGEKPDSGLEIDGREGTFERLSSITDLTLVGNGSSSKIANYKSKAMGKTNNVFVTGWSKDSKVTISDEVASEHYKKGTLSFSNWEVVLPTGVTAIGDILSDDKNVDSSFSVDKTFKSVNTATTGANTSVFYGHMQHIKVRSNHIILNL